MVEIPIARQIIIERVHGPFYRKMIIETIRRIDFRGVVEDTDQIVFETIGTYEEVTNGIKNP